MGWGERAGGTPTPRNPRSLLGLSSASISYPRYSNTHRNSFQFLVPEMPEPASKRQKNEHGAGVRAMPAFKPLTITKPVSRKSPCTPEERLEPSSQQKLYVSQASENLGSHTGSLGRIEFQGSFIRGIRNEQTVDSSDFKQFHGRNTTTESSANAFQPGHQFLNELGQDQETDFLDGGLSQVSFLVEEEGLGIFEASDDVYTLDAQLHSELGPDYNYYHECELEDVPPEVATEERFVIERFKPPSSLILGYGDESPEHYDPTLPCPTPVIDHVEGSSNDIIDVVMGEENWNQLARHIIDSKSQAPQRPSEFTDEDFDDNNSWNNIPMDIFNQIPHVISPTEQGAEDDVPGALANDQLRKWTGLEATKSQSLSKTQPQLPSLDVESDFDDDEYWNTISGEIFRSLDPMSRVRSSTSKSEQGRKTAVVETIPVEKESNVANSSKMKKKATRTNSKRKESKPTEVDEPIAASNPSTAAKSKSSRKKTRAPLPETLISPITHRKNSPPPPPNRQKASSDVPLSRRAIFYRKGSKKLEMITSLLHELNNPELAQDSDTENKVPTTTWAHLPEEERRRPFTRPNPEAQVQERSPIEGLSAKSMIRTCFRIGEAMKFSGLKKPMAGGVEVDLVIELFGE
ncbi:hypothetical protein DFH27DRAFT_317637 [Peziza echinospora]|nr:hypothetical protein DFH27DRAFT_317637 [Peziza echinospora]